MSGAPQRPPRRRFPAAARLRHQPDFRRALDGGASAGDRLIKLWGIANDAGLSRLGLMVGRRHGSAPQRNRIKRVLRESFRLLRDQLPKDLDLVCSPRPGATLQLDACVASLRSLCVTVARRLARG